MADTIVARARAIPESPDKGAAAPASRGSQRDARGRSGDTVSLPGAAAIDPLTGLRERAGGLHYDLAFRLAPILTAGGQLADCLRVLGEFELRSMADEVFASQLSNVCVAWRNPETFGNGYEVLRDLLRVAGDLCAEYAEAAEDIEAGRGLVGQTHHD